MMQCCKSECVSQHNCVAVDVLKGHESPSWWCHRVRYTYCCLKRRWLELFGAINPMYFAKMMKYKSYLQFLTFLRVPFLKYFWNSKLLELTSSHLFITPRRIWIRYQYTCLKGSTRWRRWLMHCATSRKVMGSIPHSVTRIFHWRNPSGSNMALGWTQQLREKSNRNFSWRV
jgi:hypothetical protein